MRNTIIGVVLNGLLAAFATAQDPWPTAKANGDDTQQVIRFCNRFVNGWLTQADPTSGLIPRNLRGDWYWNAKDSAADNYPFMVLTAYVTDNAHMKRNVDHMLEQEQRLSNRVDSLPDTYDFATQNFLTGEVDMDSVIFGASEYVKDGLMPITEWIGPGPYLARMEGIVRDIWKHAAIETEAGAITSTNVEVNGDQLQVLSRLYWLTGDPEIKAWSFRLADYYLLHHDLLQEERIRLRDHGCEILSGLSEAYFIASKEDPERHERYREPLYRILDDILAKGVNEDGMMPNWYNPKTGEKDAGTVSDGWGYVYNTFLTVAEVDGEKRYEDAVRHALENIHKYLETDWERGSADGYADSIEGGLNMLNRIPVASAFDWVEKSVPYILAKQRPDGIIEGWHGDGNSARTLLMYALWKTQGIAASPWRDDVKLGAVRGDDGAIHIAIRSEFPWHGALRFDRQRHDEYFHMPLDYPRINQFPEWYTVEPAKRYEVIRDGEGPVVVEGKELWNCPIALEAGQSVRLTVRETESPLRTSAYRSGAPMEANEWQAALRVTLNDLLNIDDLVAMGDANPLKPTLTNEEARDGYTWYEYTIQSTPTRAIPVVVTIPLPAPAQPVPAVVCIHGHGGDRFATYNAESIYKGFATELARTGYVTIAADVGQHDVYEPDRTLMGERLWDLIRCVDFLVSRPEVNKSRIGCAGLSLGGEMAMWLGAMDTRVAATVSCGFLTTMDHMEVNHCMCWKFDGLRELVDWTDVYAMIAPRPLQCQNGRREPYNDFTIGIVRQAIEEIRIAYADCGVPDSVVLDVHDGAHEVDLRGLTSFFQEHLGE